VIESTGNEGINKLSHQHIADMTSNPSMIAASAAETGASGLSGLAIALGNHFLQHVASTLVALIK